MAKRLISTFNHGLVGKLFSESFTKLNSGKAAAVGLGKQDKAGYSTQAKQDRSHFYDGAFVDAFLMKMKNNKDLLMNKKIWSRRSTILPEFVGSTVRIYNGKVHFRCKITEEKVGHKFGEFAMTRKRRVHAKTTGPARPTKPGKKAGKK
ncbi:hypothetical protein PRUPE_2G123500 [Prunus persica]|uniref:Small ribosomal subunit protein uS19m n=2 Tax=Prunus TaxID=3754 RepID=A0A5E4G7S7_PRUDU|nr:hypothetical protein PRUPE_2G123500 [Prunus persica]VVA35592.1 PREDICTED: 30S ribosomal S19 [Prunus dulcis]